jgi:hypothetical protein
VTRGLAGRLASAVLAALFAGACASTGPAPVEGDAARAPREAYESARQKAFAPRRFKALFSGEVSPRAGVVGRGYLSVWWNGRALLFRTSAPMGGTGRGGTLRLSGGGTGEELFPGDFEERDAIGVLLGVLDEATTGAVERHGSGYRVLLTRGRSALLDERLRIVGLELPYEARVSYEPGEGVPRKIDAKSADGSASLKLESLGPWAEGEAPPP